MKRCILYYSETNQINITIFTNQLDKCLTKGYNTKWDIHGRQYALSKLKLQISFYPVEKEMATHSSIPAWRIPWMEEPGGLQSIGSQRVRHDWVTNAYTFHPEILLPGLYKINLHLCKMGGYSYTAVFEMP